MNHAIGDWVLIEWDDIVTENSWQDKDYRFTLSDMACQAVGKVMFEDESLIQLAMIADEGGKTFNNMAAFPKGCVKSIHKLEMP